MSISALAAVPASSPLHKEYLEMALATFPATSVLVVDCSAGLERGRYVGICKFFDSHDRDVSRWFGYIALDSIRRIFGEHLGNYVDGCASDLRFIYESLHPDITLRKIRSNLQEVRVTFEVKDMTDRDGGLHRVIANVIPN